MTHTVSYLGLFQQQFPTHDPYCLLLGPISTTISNTWPILSPTWAYFNNNFQHMTHIVSYLSLFQQQFPTHDPYCLLLGPISTTISNTWPILSQIVSHEKSMNKGSQIDKEDYKHEEKREDVIITTQLISRASPRYIKYSLYTLCLPAPVLRVHSTRSSGRIT